VFIVLSNDYLIKIIFDSSSSTVQTGAPIDLQREEGDALLETVENKAQGGGMFEGTPRRLPQAMIKRWNSEEPAIDKRLASG
jgi:hypothetical protein